MPIHPLLIPPPVTFPKANIYVAGLMTYRFAPILRSQEGCTWANATQRLTTIIGGSVDDIGRWIHIWGVPWTLYQDAWGAITGYSDGPPARFDVAGLNLGIGAGQAKYSLADTPPYNIHGIWRRISEALASPQPGAIRWGKLWLYCLTPNLTHSIDVMHFDGPP